MKYRYAGIWYIKYIFNQFLADGHSVTLFSVIYVRGAFARGLMCDISHVEHIASSHDSPARSLCLYIQT